MSEQINFELVSPEEKLISEPVRMVVVPGREGEIGVGAGHASLVTALKPGVIAIHSESESQLRRIYIAGGFADITNEACIVLAEEAVPVNDLDQAAIEQEIENLKEDLELVKEDQDLERVWCKLDLAKAKLEAVTGKVQL